MASREGNNSRLRKVAALIVVFAILAAAVGAVSFALCPYGSKSQVAWTEYRNEDQLDALCIGTSLGAQCYDPAVVDEALGASSFTMCTPVQTPAESVLTLQEALEEHQIARVFYAVDFAQFWMDYQMYPGRVYLNEKWKGDSFSQRLADMAYAMPGFAWMLTEKSVNWLFPWTEHRVGFSMVGENIAMQLNGTSVVEAAARNMREGDNIWVYYGRGYGNYDNVCNFNSDSQDLYTDLGIGPLQEENLRYFADLCDLCAANGIEMVAFVPPRPDFNVVTLRDYYDEYTEQLKGIVEERGGVYYDFNLAKPELFKSQESYFWDWEHCNAAGARVVSAALAQAVQLQHAGADMDALFMSYDEKLASIDTISIVTLDEKIGDGEVQLVAEALTGTNVKPEYQFLVGAQGGELQVVRDWSPEGTCTYEPPEEGVYTVRVNARQQGTDVEYEKYTQHDCVL